MNFFSLDVKWRVRGWAKKYANSSLYGKLKMGGKKQLNEEQYLLLVAMDTLYYGFNPN
jgi:hypothetical protein